MSRCNNWPGVLAAFIEERRDRPFDWATNNCCFFACDWIKVLTGRDIAADWRNVDSALAAERALGGGGGVEVMMEAACSALGWPSCALASARRGDAVLADTDNGPALGVCLGERSAFVGPHGLWFVKTLNCRRAWRIS